MFCLHVLFIRRSSHMRRASISRGNSHRKQPDKASLAKVFLIQTQLTKLKAFHSIYRYHRAEITKDHRFPA